jgi:DNA polymerase I
MMQSSAPILIVDALNLYTRHFIANPAMVSTGYRAGEPAGGIVGFLNSLRWLIDTQHPSRVVVVWESGGSARKRKLFKEYKAHRRPQKLNRYYEDDIPDTTENRNWQVATIVSLLRFVGINQVYVQDCEADDVIGYVCKYKFPGRRKVILSSDKDFYQLLNEETRVYNPMGKRYVLPEDVFERFGIKAHNFCTAKALCGDPSDNIPGIKGVGFKTLAKRFPQLASEDDVSVHDIIADAQSRIDPKGKGPKIYQRIVDGEERLLLNWQLMYLDTQNLSAGQVKRIDHAIDNFSPKRDKMSLMRKLVKEGISSFDTDRFFTVCRAYLRD